MTAWRTASGDSADKALERLQRAVRERQENALVGLAATLKTEIVRQLSTPGAGRYYAKAAGTAGETPKGPRNASERVALARRRRQNRKLNSTRRGAAMALNAGTLDVGSITSRRVLTGLHRASKPGDPPAADSGTLRRSAFIERTKSGVRVGVAMPYAGALEFGTTKAGRNRKTVIAPRPFMRPALAKVREQFGPLFRATLSVAGR